MRLGAYSNKYGMLEKEFAWNIFLPYILCSHSVFFPASLTDVSFV